MSELPRGWSAATIGELVSPGRALAYGVLKPGDHVPGGVLLLKGYQVRNGHIDTSDQFLIGKALDDEFSRTRLRGGEVLLTVVGSVGRAALVPGALTGANVSRAIAVIPVVEEFGPWVEMSLRAPQVQAILEERTGGTAQPVLNLGEVRELRMALPPLNEQRRIVAKLDALQARSRRAREALDAVPPLLEKLRQSILAAAFRGDLTKDWRAKHKDVEPASKLLERIRAERRKKWEEAELAKLTAKGKAPKGDGWKAKYKEPEPVDAEGLPELPEGWCWASVEEVGLIESGQTTDGLAEHVSSERRDVPWFRVGDMNHEENEVVMRAAAVWLTHEDVRRFGLHVRPEGTIIFPKRGGAIATNKKRRLGQPSAYDLNTMGIIPVDSLADYVWTWFQGVDLGALNTGTSVPQINHGDIAPLALPLAPLAEAACIAKVVEGYLAALRAGSAGVDALVSRLEKLDRALLAKAFRGELVPQDSNDEPAEVMLARLAASPAATAAARTTRKRTRRGEDATDG